MASFIENFVREFAAPGETDNLRERLQTLDATPDTDLAAKALLRDGLLPYIRIDGGDRAMGKLNAHFMPRMTEEEITVRAQSFWDTLIRNLYWMWNMRRVQRH